MEKSEFYRDARSDLTGPLAGVRVLEETTTWAGPMCGCILADLGADVIKIDALEGDVIRRLPPAVPASPRRVSVWHATLSRNKRNLTLDLRHPEGRQREAADANVVAACPDGKEYCVPSGRVRPAAVLIAPVNVCVTICARIRSAPMRATAGFAVTRPIV